MRIFDIKRFAVHDGPGIRTTVFLKGCPLQCAWCHNPESRDREPVTLEVERRLNGRVLKRMQTCGREVEGEMLLKELLRDLPFYEASDGGVTFSGGEPLLQAEELQVLLRSCRQQGLHTAVDTSGYAEKQAFERIMDDTDLFLFDLKVMDPELHRKFTGVDNRMIHANADHLLRSGARVILRIPVIPGVNTSGPEIDRFMAFIERSKYRPAAVHLLPYHRIAQHKYCRLGLPAGNEFTEPDEGMLEGLKVRFERTGLPVSVGG